MGASWKQVGCHGVLQGVAPLFQQCHIPGQRGRVAGNIDDAPGGEPGEGFDGVGIQALPGRVHHHHICLDALGFQLQRRRAGVTAVKFRVFDAVSLGVVLCVLHGLGDHLDADDLAGGSGHGQGDGAHAAVQIQNGVVFRNAGPRDGGVIQALK